MSDCKKCCDLFAEAFYEEINTEQKHFVEGHLRVCTECKSEYDEMTSTLKIMDKRVRPEPEQAFWNGYWNRLSKKIEEETPTPILEKWRRTFARAFNFAPKWAFQATAAILLLILGIYIGKMVFSPSIPGVQQARELPSIISQPEPGIELINRTHNYIERSKLILLAIINFDPQTEDPYALNIPYQKQVSRELVHEAGFLKKGLADSDQGRLENLIADIEVILLQVANLESEHDFEAIELVKEGVDSRGILLKINVTDIRQSTERRNETVSTKRQSDKFRTL